MQKERLYLIFCNGKLLHITFDYFYFKRLLKKYDRMWKKVEGRKIEVEKMLENSTVAN